MLSYQPVYTKIYTVPYPCLLEVIEIYLSLRSSHEFAMHVISAMATAETRPPGFPTIRRMMERARALCKSPAFPHRES
jgi:hypothetical protein